MVCPSFTLCPHHFGYQLFLCFPFVPRLGTVCLFGWELNFLEFIIISLSVGLSIDYAIHLGVAYKCSGQVAGGKGRLLVRWFVCPCNCRLVRSFICLSVCLSVFFPICLSVCSCHSVSICLPLFLDAFSHLYKRVCLSVRPLVRDTRVEFLRNGRNSNKIASGT